MLIHSYCLWLSMVTGTDPWLSLVYQLVIIGYPWLLLVITGYYGYHWLSMVIIGYY